MQNGQKWASSGEWSSNPYSKKFTYNPYSKKYINHDYWIYDHPYHRWWFLSTARSYLFNNLLTQPFRTTKRKLKGLPLAESDLCYNCLELLVQHLDFWTIQQELYVCAVFWVRSSNLWHVWKHPTCGQGRSTPNVGDKLIPPLMIGRLILFMTIPTTGNQSASPSNSNTREIPQNFHICRLSDPSQNGSHFKTPDIDLRSKASLLFHVFLWDCYFGVG